jgi:hypothetical protein
MYTFYYAIVGEKDHAKRVSDAMDAAKDCNISCHIEVHGDATTIQAETDDDLMALQFKLSLDEIAEYEGRAT